MKNYYLSLGFFALLLLMSTKQIKMKKVQTYETAITIDLPAEKIWNVICDNYGAAANYADQIVASEYINEHIHGGEGCERICYFNENKSTYLKEKMVHVDHLKKEYTNIISEAKGLPIDAKYSQTVFKVKALTDSTCEFSAKSQYRTKPAFLGGVFKGKFADTMKDYLISVAYYSKTGKIVTKDNFKEIKKSYLTQATIAR